MYTTVKRRYSLAHVVLLILMGVGVGGCAPRVYPNATWTAPQFNPAEYPKLALIVEDTTRNARRNSTLVRQIEDEFNQVMLEKGYRLAARSDTERVTKEIKFQHSGWTESDAASLGKMLNVPGVVVVSISDYSIREDKQNYLRVNKDHLYGLDAYVRISGRIISVQEAELLGQATHSASITIRSRYDIMDAVAVVTRGLARGFPPHNYETTVIQE